MPMHPDSAAALWRASQDRYSTRFAATVPLLLVAALSACLSGRIDAAESAAGALTGAAHAETKLTAAQPAAGKLSTGRLGQAQPRDEARPPGHSHHAHPAHHHGRAHSHAQDSGGATPLPTRVASLPCTCAPAALLNAATDPAAAAAEAAARRGSLRPVQWADLALLDEQAISAVTWQSMRLGCTVLHADPAWSGVCDAAARLPESPDAATRLDFLHQQLRPWQAIGQDGQPDGLATGYYEPVLHGSRTRSARYRYPLYAPPDDLLTLDLGALVPELRGRQVRGRLDGHQVVPYFSRADIEHATPASLQGREIVWIDDPIEVFFLHVQGSGRVELEEGGGLHVGYADQNGQPFRSVARQLIEQGELSVAQASLQGMKAWAKAHPEKVDAFLDGNPSYVFFREIAGDLPGPLGTLGVPLLGEATAAVDAKVIPLGAPIFVDTSLPLSRQPLRRVAMAQDTGGAISGAVRVDYFWGLGDDALAQAGRMRQKLRMWVLLPPGFHPENGSLLPDAVAATAVSSTP